MSPHSTLLSPAPKTNSPSALGAAIPPIPVRRFSVEEYHKLIRAGVLRDGEQVELIEGWIVSKMSRNPPHDVAMTKSNRALTRVLPDNWHVRVQTAITTVASEPEPDLAVVEGEPDDYRLQHPSPAQIGMLGEVSDSSLAYDRSIKKRIYAAALIAVYWIINVADRQVEVYSDPSGPDESPHYRKEETFALGSEVPVVLKGIELGRIPVSALLPA